MGEQRGGAPREDEARVGEVVGGGERGEEGGEVRRGGEAARDEEARVERAEVGVGRRGEGREQRGRVTEQRGWHQAGLVHAWDSDRRMPVRPCRAFPF